MCSHCGVEVPELSTNKQHTLTISALMRYVFVGLEREEDVRTL
jgi:hypothetical protein